MEKIAFKLFSIGLFTASCSSPAAHSGGWEPLHSTSNSQPIANATIKDAQGNQVGKASIHASADRAQLEVEVSGLTAGKKGFHLHSIGKCDLPDFKSAGGHLNPFNTKHGRENVDGSHLGDLPNVEISDDGSFAGSLSFDQSAMQLQSLLFDADGTAIVIHQGADDYLSDPSGKAGPRIACGILSPDK